METDPLFIPRSTISSRIGKYSAWGLSGKTLGLLLLLLVLSSLVGSFYLNQASQTTAAGLEITWLTREREYWRQENARLRRRIAEREALPSIRARAEELGFVQPEVVEYLLVESPVNPDTSAGGLTLPHPAQRDLPKPDTPGSQEWWRELVARFVSWMSSGH
ncbi:MAG: hypothetical protein MUP64_02280 [Anaerolineae bacterium]|nr:hypothetical protein [Anaerolineae bacterium]